MPRVEILEISPDLVAEVSTFLAREIGRGISAAEFPAVFERRWAPGPAGYALLGDRRVVGALATIRAARPIRGRTRRFCNLSSIAVAPAYRPYAPALLQHAIGDPDTIVTNFTASAAVAGILRAFRFIEAPSEERVLLPMWPTASHGSTWTVDDIAIEEILRSYGYHDQANCVRDHRGARAKWVLVNFGRDCCAVALHLMRVRRLHFAYVLYCSAPEKFLSAVGAVRQAATKTWGWHLLAWPHARFGSNPGSVGIRRPQPVMFRGDDVTAADIDGLYSELTLLPILR